jgi:DNA repair photolyase
MTEISISPTEKTGIARLAAESPLREERNEVEYFDLSCRTILNGNTGRRMPFDYSINPYRGCEFGCTYCYARYTHEFLELRDPLDFERKIYAKRDAGAVLARDLARRPALADLESGGWIALGTATDPYQPIERRRRATREVLETLARRDGLRVSITTKSDLVLRDLDVLRELDRRGELSVNLTITTTDRDLARRLEPRAPTPDKRFRAVEALNKTGIRAGVFAIPILPSINDSRPALRALVSRAKEAGARWLTAAVLFLKPAAKARFFPWLEETFPGLVPSYRRLYRGTYPPAPVQDRIRRLVRALRMQYGLEAEEPERRARSPTPRAGSCAVGLLGESAAPSASAGAASATPRGQLSLFPIGPPGA